MTMTIAANQWINDTEMISDEDLHRRGLHHLQLGQWEAAITCLTELFERHPGQKYYQDLLDEAHLKARLSQQPPQGTQRRDIPRSPRIWAVIIINLLLYLTVAGQQLYNHQIAPTLARQQAALTRQQLLEEGEQLLAQGDLKGAEHRFWELLKEDPHNAAAQAGLEEIERQQRLAMAYQVAQTLMASQAWDAAFEQLQAISAESPGFRDVQQQLDRIRRQRKNMAAFEEANGFYQAGMWRETINRLTDLREQAPRFEPDAVAARLFDSYMNLAREALSHMSARDLPREVSRLQAVVYLFELALQERPSDPEATTEHRLAETYLAGLMAYRHERWETAVDRLGQVYTAVPRYAAGRAAWLLQNAHLQSGRAAWTSGDTAGALEHFRQVIAIGKKGYGRPVPQEADNMLRQADQWAQTERVEDAVAVYRSLLARMGFAGMAPPSTPEGDSQAWQRQGSTPAPPKRKVVEADQTRPPAQLYVVQPGDTLSEIALHYNTTVRALVEANEFIRTPDIILPGWRLVIPVQ